MTGPAIIDDGGHTVAISMPITSAASPDGGLIKQGNGTLTLTGASSYNGPTVINAGKFVLSGTGSITGSSGIALNGGKLTQISTTAVSPTVTINSGTLNGSNATLNSVIVNNGGIIANGNNDTGVLTINSLTFNAAATLNITLAGATATAAPGIATSTLTTAVGGPITINATNALWNNGTYDLLGYSSIAGPGFSDFSLGNVTGLTQRQTASLSNVSGDIALTINGGNAPVWTGLQNGNWTTAIITPLKNWTLQSGGAPTDFLTADTVIFNDTATGTTSVNISDASVAPTSTTFNNSVLNYTISSTGGFGISSGFVVKNGTAAVTIATTNSYAGGTTVNAGTLNVAAASALGTGPVAINGGTVNANNTLGTGLVTLNGGKLNLNSSAALGAGVVTINAGTLDNISGTPVVLANNNAINLNGNVSFTGTSNLSMGTGAVTLGGSGTSDTVTVNAGDLAIGPVTGTSFGLTKAGPGVLSIVASANDNNAARVSNITGDLNVLAGTFQIGGNDFHAGGLAGSGIVEDGSNTVRWLFINNAANDTFAGVLQDGTGGATLGLNKNGNGTLTLTGANTYNHATNVQEGTLVYSGTTNNTFAIDTVGTVAGANGILVLSPGSNFAANFINSGAIFSSSIDVANNATGGGDVRISDASSSFTVARQITIGSAGFGGFTQTNGNTSIGGFLAVGGSANGGVVNLSGGKMTLTAAPITLGYVGTAGTAVMNVSGNATLSLNGAAGNGLWVGELGNATLNVSGNANISIPTNSIILGKGGAATAGGVLNLLGGTTTVNSVTIGIGTGTVNFNGGTLKANTASAGFLAVTNAYVYGGGATIDDGGNAITIAQPLLAPTGGGVTNTGVTASGSGFIDTPIVQVSGGGTGATAVANIDANGNLTGITITNPGQNYTNASFSIVGGGVGSSGSIGGSPAIVANVSGGFTKNGAGSVTLTGASTYTGNTVVTGGKLFVNGSLANTTVVMNGGTLSGSGTIAGPITGGTAAHIINPGATTGARRNAHLRRADCQLEHHVGLRPELAGRYQRPSGGFRKCRAQRQQNCRRLAVRDRGGFARLLQGALLHRHPHGVAQHQQPARRGEQHPVHREHHPGSRFH